MAFPSSSDSPSQANPPLRSRTTAVAGSAVLLSSMLLNSAAIAQTAGAAPEALVGAPLTQEPVDVPAAPEPVAPMQVESASVTIEPAAAEPIAEPSDSSSYSQGLVQAPDLTPMADPDPADHPDAFLPARPSAAVSVGAVKLSAEGVQVGASAENLVQAPVATEVVAPPTAAMVADAGIPQAVAMAASSNAPANYATSAPPSTVIAPSYFDPQLLKAMGQITNSLRMLFPVAIPAPITSLFGWRVHPISGTQRLHTGTDIGAPMGAPVLAAMPGRVILADDMGGYGLTVAIEHDNGVRQTLYAHLSELFVRPGDMVQQGMVIGRVGSTGASTGPHLHFELRQMLPDGTWVALDAGRHLENSMANLLQSLQIAQQPRTTALAKPKR